MRSAVIAPRPAITPSRNDRTDRDAMNAFIGPGGIVSEKPSASPKARSNPRELTPQPSVQRTAPASLTAGNAPPPDLPWRGRRNRARLHRDDLLGWRLPCESEDPADQRQEETNDEPTEGRDHDAHEREDYGEDAPNRVRRRHGEHQKPDQDRQESDRDSQEEDVAPEPEDREQRAQKGKDEPSDQDEESAQNGQDCGSDRSRHRAATDGRGEKGVSFSSARESERGHPQVFTVVGLCRPKETRRDRVGSELGSRVRTPSEGGGR